MSVRAACAVSIFAAAMLTSAFLAAGEPAQSNAGTPKLPCAKDAMLVFDASGSMTGPGFGENVTTRIETARQALKEVLPEVTPARNLGLLVFGPGNRTASECAHIDLRLPPAANSTERIMTELNGVQPYGQTPIAASVKRAAEVLDYRNRPAVIVLLTDGEETCGGNPCALADELKRQGLDTTVHVIGYMSGRASGMPPAYPTRCLSERTGGFFIGADTKDDLVKALRRTLGCDLSSENTTGQDVRIGLADRTYGARVRCR